MRRLVALVYRARRFLRARTRGVKVMLFDEDGALLLVRHTYGRTDLFLLPGGGIRPFEAPAAAAAREVREELGCGVAELIFVSTHVATGEVLAGHAAANRGVSRRPRGQRGLVTGGEAAASSTRTARLTCTGRSSICPRIAPAPAFSIVGPARIRRTTSMPSTTRPKAA